MNAMNLIVVVLSAVILSGCSHLHVENVTKDGRVFTACAWSFLYDRNLEGLQFDYEKGTLDVIDFAGKTDKETMGKAIDTVGSALELMKAIAK